MGKPDQKSGLEKRLCFLQTRRRGYGTETGGSIHIALGPIVMSNKKTVVHARAAVIMAKFSNADRREVSLLRPAPWASEANW